MLNYEAKNYAQALLELALERGELKLELERVETVLKVINDNPSLLRGFKSAFVSKSEKLKMLEDIFKPFLSKELFALIAILTRRSSLFMLVEIIEDLIVLANTHLGLIQGFVHSPTPLSKEKIENLETAIGKKFNKTVRLINKIDKSLLAGLRVEIDNHVIELSFASLLEGAREFLINGGKGGRRWL